MFFKLLLLFIGIPLIEIAVLVKMGELLGFWPTMAVILITAFAGATLARLEGLRVLGKIHDELHQGHLPAEELIDGLLILVAGIVLLTPGFFTDAAGILVLIPWSRSLIKKWLKKKFDRYIESRQDTAFYFDLN